MEVGYYKIVYIYGGARSGSFVWARARVCVNYMYMANIRATGPRKMGLNPSNLEIKLHQARLSQLSSRWALHPEQSGTKN
jgi:adenosyl cobinamide kinase/adenosyl cobinamide phosphate guanylyltransferase